MSYFAPFGNFQNETIDPEELALEWQEAKRIATSLTHWQMCTEDSGYRFDQTVVKNGASVSVHRSSYWGLAGHGTYTTATDGELKHHSDAIFLEVQNSPGYGGEEPGEDTAQAWLIPYLKGMVEVADGNCAVTWQSEFPELVLFSCSWRTYRLSSSDALEDNGLTTPYTGTAEDSAPFVPQGDVDEAKYFGPDCRPRIKFAVCLDGTNLAGSGPGMNLPTNRYNVLRGQGLGYKTEKSTSTIVQLVPAGVHRASPVAGQFSAAKQDRKFPMKTAEIDYYQGDGKDNSTEFGVSIPACSLSVIRFPRGTMLGG